MDDKIVIPAIVLAQPIPKPFPVEPKAFLKEPEWDNPPLVAQDHRESRHREAA